ncbi:Disease resistance protein RGA2, partial [Dichanthelium oligosanthes]
MKMEENGWSLPAAISRVVGKLRFYLENSSDSGKFKGTMKMLDLLEEKLKLLQDENLQRVSIDREEEMGTWLQEVKEAADDTEELVKDMETGESVIPDVVTWFRSDSSNLLRMKYTVGRLVSVCTEGESLLGMRDLDEDVWESVRNDSASSTPDHAYVVGRDREIAMILDMILEDAHFKVMTSLESWAIADTLQISQKGWIIETLQNINLSQKRHEGAEVSLYQKGMGGTVEYTQVYNNTASELMNPMIIPMLGISGVGKTTLAQLIFNDKRVQKHFRGQSAWIYCTDNIRKEELMAKILVSLQPQHKILDLGFDLNSLHNQLQSFIEGKKFLLVLDDVSDEIRAVWGEVRSVLSRGAPGSVVLVTTQLYGVASFMGTTTPIFLNPLQYDDLWKLFKHHAFFDLPQSVRHLSINMNNMNVPRVDYNIKNLRSLMLFGGL